MKMMPFDNKSEIQVVFDMPEGATLENTQKATKAIGDYISTVKRTSPLKLNGEYVPT